MRIALLDDRIAAAGQIRPEELDPLAAAGFTLIVNNRPDGEDPGQPAGAEIEAAAKAAGLNYRHIPISGMPDRASVEAVAAAMREAEAKILLFCRSGTRSTWAWALARAREGEDPEGLIHVAARAGYDLAALPLYIG